MFINVPIIYVKCCRDSKAWPNAQGLEPCPIAGSRVQISLPANENYDDKTKFRNPRQKSFKREDFEKFSEKMRQVSMQVSWHQLQQMQSVLHKTQTKRFAGKRRTPKYGSLSKAFTETQITQFFRVIDDDKFRLIFQYQAQLGLRIGEAVRVNVKDINFETREITLKTEKAKVIDTLLVPNQLFKNTLAFISKHEKEIEKAMGYIFFRSAERSLRAEHFVEQNYVRNRFRCYVIKAGLDQTYDTSDESVEGRQVRSLHRLTTHSLRHYAITSFSKQTNGNLVLTSRFARHADPSTTMVYVSTKKEELYQEIDNTFSLERLDKLKRNIIAEFK